MKPLYCSVLTMMKIDYLLRSALEYEVLKNNDYCVYNSHLYSIDDYFINMAYNMKQKLIIFKLFEWHWLL